MITQERTSYLAEQSYENTSSDSNSYTTELITAVEAGLAELDRGEFFTLEEVERELPSWIIR